MAEDFSKRPGRPEEFPSEPAETSNLCRNGQSLILERGVHDAGKRREFGEGKAAAGHDVLLYINVHK